MKKIKKFLLTIAMTMIFSISAFAASGFEFILNVPLGLGVGVPPKSYKEGGAKSGVGFDIGVAVQLGYMAQVTSGFGISALFELGYAHDTFAMSYNDAGVKVSQSISFESVQIGLLPKFNIGAFAIGIGGGIKMPLAGKQTSKFGSEKYSEKLSMDYFWNAFNPGLIGYIKGTFDYSIFFMDNLAFNIGLYLGYDMIKGNESALYGTTAEYWGSFDIGVELGLKFGPKA